MLFYVYVIKKRKKFPCSKVHMQIGITKAGEPVHKTSYTVTATVI